MRVLFPALLLAAASTAAAAVPGRVLTADGKPVPGAVVTAYALETPEARAERLTAGQERRGLVSVKSAADGTFRLEVADAVVGVGVRADGYAPALATAVQGEPAELALVAAAPRRGRVAIAGKGAPGAIVVFMANDNDPQSPELVLRAAADGTFEAADPDLWATSLAVLHPDTAPLAASPAPPCGSMAGPARSPARTAASSSPTPTRAGPASPPAPPSSRAPRRGGRGASPSRCARRAG